MTSEAQVSDQLHDLAGTVTATSLSPAAVSRVIRRRRSRNRVGIAVGAAGVVVGVVFGISHLVQTPANRSTSGLPPASDHGGSVATTMNSPGSTSPEQQLPAPTLPVCGAALGRPIVARTDQGVWIKPGTVTFGGDRAPIIALRVTADKNVYISAPLDPALVVLRDGHVVAVSKPVDNEPPGLKPMSMFVAQRYRLGPNNNYPVTVQGTATPCAGTTWKQIRLNPARYSARLLVNTQGLMWGQPAGPAEWLAATVTLGSA